MRLTVIGSGDAFGSGGRFNTCFMVEAQGVTALLDCGATSLVAMHKQGIDPGVIDAIILSHLHGDHFAGAPFLLIEGQYLARRKRPLVVAGPPGTRDRLHGALEVLFPGSTSVPWRFPWEVTEIPVGQDTRVLGLSVVTTEVIHPSGAPSTAVRISDGRSVLAYSGDTEWTDALLSVASGADLFIVECYDYDRAVTGHMNWATLRGKLPDVGARRILATHMNPTMLARLGEARAAGVEIAEDGQRFEF